MTQVHPSEYSTSTVTDGKNWVCAPNKADSDAEKDSGPATTWRKQREGKDSYSITLKVLNPAVPDSPFQRLFLNKSQVHDHFCLNFGSCSLHPKVLVDPLGSGTQKRK